MLDDPRRHRRFAPRCPVKLLTGLDCPGCGGMRMVHDLSRGHLRAAARDNVFVLLALPGAVWLRSAARDSTRRRRIDTSTAIAALAWMVVRNVPRWPLRPSVR